MDEVTLKETEESRALLLGVTIQCDLKWGEQIKKQETKLKKRLAQTQIHLF